MKCSKCGYQNKDTWKTCKKCNSSLVVEPLWTPDWGTHRKILLWIFSVLIVVFFVLKWGLRTLPPPYHIREIPSEMTPWLKK